jgi:hypothetical protein
MAIAHGVDIKAILDRDKATIETATKGWKKAEAAVEKLKESLRTNSEAHVAEIKAANQSLNSEKARTKKILSHRPYESQLVAAFSISLAVRWQRKIPNAPISFNDFQGNRDKNFGDFVGMTAGSCWLIELKRDWSCVRTEARKPIRVRQAEALSQRTDALRQLADRCHWLGWGESDAKRAILKFSPYWQTWRVDAPPVEAKRNDAFVADAFDGRIGLSPAVFAEYLRFLSEASGSPSDEGDEDTIAALIFERDGKGDVKYWIAPDLLSVGKAIEERIELRQRQIERQREIEEEKRRRENPEIDPPGFSL